MQSACTQASDAIQSIIDLINIPENNNIALNVILTALGIGLSLIPDAGPVVESAIGISADFINGLTKAIQQVPVVAQAIWPTGTADSRNIQIGALINELGGVNGICSSLHGNFHKTLRAAQGDGQKDTSGFLAFAAGGAFSLPLWNAPAVLVLNPQEQSLLLQGFTTFLISEALSRSGWKALMLPGVDPAGIQAGTAPCPLWAGSACDKGKNFKCNGYDSLGQCENNLWWYGKTTNSAYTILHNGKFDKGNTPGILNTTFANGWSTGSLLFENAAIW